MAKFLLRIALNQDDSNELRRKKTGYIASIVGIIVNLILAGLKLTIGISISSIGVIADGFNNVTDTLSSVIAFIAFKVSHKPPDPEHPYGHGRVEYIAGLIISIIVVFVGLQFAASSFREIIDPNPVKFQLSFFIILLLSILVKIWLSRFNKYLGKEINSTSIEAMSLDALGDVLTTSVVVLSLLLGRFITIPIDGYVGIVVSALIIFNGFNIVRETVSTLIGEAPDRETMESIKNDILNYKFVKGVHDLHIHNYGEEKAMAVVDVEFPAELGIIKTHKLVTRIEREIGRKYSLNLVVHMDPLDEESESRYLLRQEIKEILKAYEFYKSMHDFKILKGDEADTVEFDMVIYWGRIGKRETQANLKEDIEDLLKSEFPGKNFNVTIDIDFG